MTALWRRSLPTPLLSPQPGTVFTSAVTTPDIVLAGDTAHLYVGAVAEGQERLVHVALPVQALVEGTPLDIQSQARVVLAPGPGEHDCRHVFDPAALVDHEGTTIFYSAVGAGPDSIGKAVSGDGIRFCKAPLPVLTGRSPEAVRFQDCLYLFYVLPGVGKGYEIHLATSRNGGQFVMDGSEAVLGTGTSGAWDGYEVTTPRIFHHNGFFYMTYAGNGDADRSDAPRAFGLARSADLVSWTKYPGNPVFTCGAPGTWDDGAIWFGTVFEWHESLHLLYEGGAAGDLTGDGVPLTQVGMASVSVADFDAAMQAWLGKRG